MTKEELKDKEAQLDALALDLYEASERTFTPLFPFVFVRVLQKEQTRNGIIIPGIEQNKPVHEGIVLSTWTHHTVETTKTTEQGTRFTRTVVNHSQFTPGDHVAFPHWAGAPVFGFDDKLYRVIKETEWDFSKDGGIFGTINHEHEDDVPRGILIEMLHELVGNQSQDRAIIGMAHKIEDRLQLVDRQQASVTLSGR